MTSPSVCLCFTTIWKYSFFSQELVLPSGFYDSRFLLFTGVQKRDLVFFFSNRKCLSMKAVHSCYLKTVLGTTPCAKDSPVNNSCCRDNPSRVEKVRSNPSEEVAADLGNAALQRGQAEQSIRPHAVGWQKWRCSVSDVVMCWKTGEQGRTCGKTVGSRRVLLRCGGGGQRWKEKMRDCQAGSQPQSLAEMPTPWCQIFLGTCWGWSQRVKPRTRPERWWSIRMEEINRQHKDGAGRWAFHCKDPVWE